jgi:hypothetical protein
LLAYDWYKRHALDELTNGLREREMLYPEAAANISIAKITG